MDRTYTIKEAAVETGVTAHTLRYYERIGLLEPIGRESNGRRSFGEADIYSVRFLTMLRATGMPIRDMLVFMRLTRIGDETVKELAGHMSRARAQDHLVPRTRARGRGREARGPSSQQRRLETRAGVKTSFSTPRERCAVAPSLSYRQIACCDVSIGAEGPCRAAYQAPSRI